LGAGSFDRRDHFDASIAGKTYVKLNDRGCERIIDAGRPRTTIFLSAATGRSERLAFAGCDLSRHSRGAVHMVGLA
jgi:hypothetical protein